MNLYQQISAYRNRDDIYIKNAGESPVAYRDFFENVDRLAETLDSILPAKGVVFSDLPKSVESVTLLMACIKLGLGFCFIDTTLPTARKLSVFNRVNPILCVCTPEFGADLTANNESSLCADLLAKSPVTFQHAYLSVNKINTQYDGNIIFTSGSTGEPKGVMVGLLALAHYVDSMLEVMNERAGTWLSLCPIHFDVFQLDFLVQFARGFNIVIADSGLLPQQIMTLLKSDDITEFLAISTILKMMGLIYQGKPQELPKLTRVYYGGEGCPVSVLKTIAGIFPQAKFCQFYGPTENTNNTTFFKFDQPFDTDTGFMPLGNSLKHVDIQLIDEHGSKIQEPRIEGQIIIAGQQLMDGYLGTEQTEQLKIFEDGSKAYYTGDFGYRDEQGRLWFTGRKDDLVKIRGNRVSLQEVEAAVLKSMPAGAYAIALVRQKNGFDSLVAGVSSDKKIEIKSIKSDISKTLPVYAVPESIIEIDFSEIKTLSTGKLDRKNFKACLLKQLEG